MHHFARRVADQDLPSDKDTLFEIRLSAHVHKMGGEETEEGPGPALQVIVLVSCISSCRNVITLVGCNGSSSQSNQLCPPSAAERVRSCAPRRSARILSRIAVIGRERYTPFASAMRWSCASHCGHWRGTKLHAALVGARRIDPPRQRNARHDHLDHPVVSNQQVTKAPPAPNLCCVLVMNCHSVTAEISIR